MDRRDWLLLLLGMSEPDGSHPPPVDRVRVMKCLFVLGETVEGVKDGDYYDFTPYNYGPFDSAVYRDADQLGVSGLIQDVKVNGSKAYLATPEGVERAKQLEKDHPKEAAFLLKVRTWANRLPFAELLKAIYKRWPEQRANSVFMG